MPDRRPPGPRGGTPGNLAAYDRDRLGFLTRCRQDYGDWVSIDDRTVLLSDPVAIRQVLRGTNTAFALEAGDAGPPGGSAALAARARHNAAARRRTVRGMSLVPPENHAAELTTVFERTVLASGGRRVDLTALLRRAFGTAAVSYLVRADDPDLVDAVARLHAAADDVNDDPFDPPQWWPSGRLRRLRRAAGLVREIVQTLVAERRAGGGAAPHDPLSAMVADTAADTGEIAAGVMAAMRGAFGGTGVAAAWALKEVARRPDIERGLRQEVAEPAERRYLAAVISETLRLHPPVWLLMRDVLQATELGGWSLRPGDRLMMCPRLLHRDSRWWSSPESFDPDRWSAPAPAAYLPFGAGPRACLGARLATVQLTGALALLWGRLTVEVGDADDMRESFSTLAYPARCPGRIRTTADRRLAPHEPP